MSPTFLLWLACGVGALLFGVAGLLLGRLRQPREPSHAPRGAQGAAAPAQDGSATLEAERSARQALEDAHRELRAKFQSTNQALKLARQATEERTRQLEAAEAELQRLQARPAGDPDLEDRAASAQASLEAARRQAAQLESRARHAEAALQEMRAELQAAQRQALAEASCDPTERAAEARTERHEAVKSQRQAETDDTAALARQQVMEKRIAELEQLLEQARGRATRDQDERLAAERQRVAQQRRQLADAQAALAAQQKELKGLEGQSQHLRSQLEQRSEEVTQRNERVDELEKELAALRGQAEDLEKLRDQSADRAAKAARADELQAQVFRLQDTLREQQRTVDELKELESVREAYEAQKLDLMASRQRASDAEQERQLRLELKEELEDLRRERDELAEEAQALEATETARRDLALRVGVLEQHVEDLEGLRDSRRQLQEVEAEGKELRAENETLRVELASLRAQGLARQPPALPTEAPETDLEGVVHKLLNEGAAHCAALADELGLVVAAAGDHADEMAAMSAFYSQLGDRSRDILPLGPLRQLILTDENGLRFTAQPVETSLGQLMLATISSAEIKQPLS